MPIIIGDSKETMEVADKLFEQGIWAHGIRPPTVPPGTARVRLSLTLSMTDAALEKAAGTIAESAEEVGIARV